MHHHPESNKKQNGEGERQDMGQREKDEPGSKDRGTDGHHPSQSQNANSGCKVEGPNQSANTGSGHEEPEGVGAAMKDIFSEDRHKHCIGRPHEVDPSEEEEDKSDRGKAQAIGEPFLQTLQDMGSVDYSLPSA